MALPISRDYSAVDTGPLPHTTVNNIQDSIVGAKHGPKTEGVQMGGGLAVGSMGFTTGLFWLAVAATDAVEIEIPLPIGAVILGYNAHVLQVGAPQITIDLREQIAGGANSSIQFNAGNATGGTKVLTETAPIATTVVSGTKYYVRFDAANIADSFYAFEIRYQVP